MKYIKIINGEMSGSILTLKEVISANQDKSIPSVLTPELLADLGYAEVLPAVYNPDLKQTSKLKYSDADIIVNSDGKYQRVLKLVPCDSVEEFNRYTRKLKEVTEKRDSLLKASEFTQLSDSSTINIYFQYRDELKNLNKDGQDPYLVEFPADPLVSLDDYKLALIKIQEHINKVVTSLGYDSSDSISKYLTPGNPFFEECQNISLWIGNVWTIALQINTDVENNIRSMPINIIDELPIYTPIIQ